MSNVRLVAPTGAGGVTLGGVEYSVADGLVEVPALHVATAREFGFIPYNEAYPDQPIPPAPGEATAPEPDPNLPIPSDEELAAMDKGGLREFLKSRGVIVAPAMGEPKLRALAEDQVRTMRDEALPDETAPAGAGADTLAGAGAPEAGKGPAGTGAEQLPGDAPAGTVQAPPPGGTFNNGNARVADPEKN